MAVLFWIFLDQICPKWIKLDQTCSNWISHQSKNVSIQSCHIYKLDKNCHFILDQIGSDLSKMDQTWSNLLKLDFSTTKKCFYTKLSHLQIGQKWPFYFGSDWIRSVQNGLNLTKLVQIGSNQINLDQLSYLPWG